MDWTISSEHLEDEDVLFMRRFLHQDLLNIIRNYVLPRIVSEEKLTFPLKKDEKCWCGSLNRKIFSLKGTIHIMRGNKFGPLQFLATVEHGAALRESAKCPYNDNWNIIISSTGNINGTKWYRFKEEKFWFSIEY